MDPRVQIVTTMDGIGDPAAKISRYEKVVRNQPAQFAGFKDFYTEDTDPLTPEPHMTPLGTPGPMKTSGRQPLPRLFSWEQVLSLDPALSG